MQLRRQIFFGRGKNNARCLTLANPQGGSAVGAAWSGKASWRMWALKYGWDLESKREAQQLEVPIPPWLVLGTGMYSGRSQLQVRDGNLKVSLTLLCVS